jgi:hypothetical protein
MDILCLMQEIEYEADRPKENFSLYEKKKRWEEQTTHFIQKWGGDSLKHSDFENRY